MWAVRASRSWYNWLYSVSSRQPRYSMSSATKPPTFSKSTETSSYHKLRKLAQALIHKEKRCTLTATSLVHELFLKLRKTDSGVQFESDEIPPFSARIMKRMLVDRARSRLGRQKAENISSPVCGPNDLAIHKLRAQLIELDDAIVLLAQSLPLNAELVRRHLYNEISIEQAAHELGISRAEAYRKWAFSKAWLLNKLIS